MMPTVVESPSAASPVVDTLGPLLLDGAWGRQARDYLGRAKEILFAEHQAGATGGAIVAQWTAVVDHVVKTLYDAPPAPHAARYPALGPRGARVRDGG